MVMEVEGKMVQEVGGKESTSTAGLPSLAWEHRLFLCHSSAEGRD